MTGVTVTEQTDRPGWRSGRWRAAAVAVALLVAGFAAVAGMLTESAPVRLSGVTPADGVALTAPPDQVDLLFTGGPDLAQVHVAVTSAGGAVVTSGEPRVVGERLVVPVTIRAAGAYLIGYHVVLADGTQASGVSRFSVSGAGGRAGPPAPTSPSTVDAAGGHEHDPTDPFNATLVGLDLVMIVVAAVLMLRRPRR